MEALPDRFVQGESFSVRFEREKKENGFKRKKEKRIDVSFRRSCRSDSHIKQNGWRTRGKAHEDTKTRNISIKMWIYHDDMKNKTSYACLVQQLAPHLSLSSASFCISVSGSQKVLRNLLLQAATTRRLDVSSGTANHSPNSLWETSAD